VTSGLGSARHRSREVALQVLFAIDLRRAKEGVEPVAQEVFDDVAANFEMPEAARAFARELVCGVTTHGNVLRMATYELLETQTPVGVVLDEAVQLARRFGDDPSPAFVNGVLDGVARAVRREPV